MLRTFSDWLNRVSTGWVALASLVIFILFTALVLPGQAAAARASSGQSGTPDLSLYYSASDLYRMAESYGAEGRQEYIRARFTFDMAWPMVYTLFLSTAISWLYSRLFAVGSTWRLANFVPVLGMLLDYLENLSTSLVIYRYPLQTPIVDSLATVFTATKWIFVSASFVVLVVGILAFSVKRLRGYAAR